jgi:phospholipid-binding lipoprotein MlaA
VNYSILSLLALLPFLSGCTGTGKHPATQPVHATSSAVGDDFANVQVQKVNDPLQGFNRSMFGFNDKITTYALRPVAHGYALIVPLPARTSISNFFDNLQFPVRFVNSVLQGKLQRSAQETGKFVFNSTFGIGGLFRVSDHVSGLADIPPEDFGQTLSVWGVPPGPYLVIPLLGPSDCRDAVGFAVDWAITPLDWHPLGVVRWTVLGDAASFGLSATRYLNGLPKAVEAYDQLKAEAVDPYIAMRDGYLSYRAAQVKK